MTKRMQFIVAALMAAAFTFVCYGHSLWAPLMWDDMDVVTPNGVPLAFKDIPSYFTAGHWLTIKEAGPRPWRPLRDSYLAVLTSLGDGRVWLFHAGNLLLQAVNVFLVFLLARRLIPGLLAPLLVAAIFATHPMHTEVVVWTKNCAELLALMLVLISALLFMQRSERPDDAPPERAHWAWPVALVLYLLALLCKESALPLPGLLVLWAVLWLTGRARRRAILMTLPFWLAGIAYTIYQHGFLSTRVTPGSAAIPTLNIGQKLLVSAETVATYLGYMILPIRNNPLPEFWPYPEATSLQTVLLLIGGAALVGLLALHALRQNRLSFGFWWMLLALGPVANLVDFNSARPIAEQRLYMPSLGFALLVGAVVVSFRARACPPKPPRRRVRAYASAAVIAIIVICAALSARMGPPWATELNFWRWTTRASPNNFFTHYNLAVMYTRPPNAAADASASEGRERQARASGLKAMWLNPYGADITYNLGNSFARGGDYVTARMFYRRCLNSAPHFARAHFNLGYDYLMLGDKEKAAAAMRLSALMDKDCARRAHPYLAQLYYDLGRKDEALDEAEAALAIDDNDRPLHLLAAKILAEKGRHDEAQRRLRRADALRRKPEELPEYP